MHPLTPPDSLSPRRILAQGFAERYAGKPTSVDEMTESNGSLRPYWQPFVSMLDELGPRELGKRWEQARRFIHDNGVSHNVYGDPNGLDRPWSLDLIPLLIPSLQWERLSEGLVQRAQLLDRLLADLYGPGETVLTGLLPPELLWANMGFLRPCHGSIGPQGRWLHLYAADIVRRADGEFQVLSDRTQAPSGAGYSLENRLVLSRTLSSEFRQCNVERLASFFSSLRSTLASLAPWTYESPHIVLLTPGPYNETYFEHSYLARYLGYPLVQGNDLTVRDANVYVKTLEGLRRVDVILRRVDDDYCDPLEMHPGSRLGVPGLLQCVRMGKVAVANALGSGILQAAGFLPFLPALCRHLLGEELKLPSVQSWWCGHPDSLRYVLDHLSDLVIKSAYPTQGEDPVFAQDLTREQLAELALRISDSPERYVAQERAISCTTPSLVADDLEPRHFVIRSYLVAQGDSYSVMRGALTRITPSTESLVVSLQRGGGSKDTWIVADGPVSQVTLLPPPGEPVAISRGGGDLTSRIAEDLFWLGRYIERAESQVRLCRGTIARITDQSGVDNRHAIETLLRAWPKGFLLRPNSELNLEFIEGLLGDVDGSGLRGMIASVHSFARVLRDRISSDGWRILQEIYTAVTDVPVDPNRPAARIPELLDNLIERFAAFVGLAGDSMTRGMAWRFLDIGRRVERVDFTARFVSGTLTPPGNDSVLLEAVLEVMDCSLTYRRRYLTHLEAHAVADLLLADETNPRGVAFQLAQLDQHLEALPRENSQPDRNRDRRTLLKLRTTIQLADLMEVCNMPFDQPRKALKSLLAEVNDQVALLADAIARLYFSHAEFSRELGEVSQEST
jgi:uncharacterized circularly permuted ATP-grasp superfamily protein/uncharacterized alpha-E superfamily protein